jgi:hypothetical protein
MKINKTKIKYIIPFIMLALNGCYSSIPRHKADHSKTIEIDKILLIPHFNYVNNDSIPEEQKLEELSLETEIAAKLSKKCSPHILLGSELPRDIPGNDVIEMLDGCYKSGNVTSCFGDTTHVRLPIDAKWVSKHVKLRIFDKSVIKKFYPNARYTLQLGNIDFRKLMTDNGVMYRIDGSYAIWDLETNSHVVEGLIGPMTRKTIPDAATDITEYIKIGLEGACDR